ncbi:MAG: type II toxin-antitoxin system VapC family toxin [Candidatus Electrothrix sp. Rat3]|nr:type II toxin-antitoxin system VapC family toxin [Candidatus Electrothrix rattekaaiensis]
MTAVLDTHVWLWWLNQDSRLKTSWRECIDQADQVGVSAITLFEVSWLERHGRIELPCSRSEWFDKALTGSCIQLFSITPEIASQAVDLPEHHSDPQDRIIIATALVHDALLLSADKKFRLYRSLKNKLIA